jgi:hypothetical protein
MPTSAESAATDPAPPSSCEGSGALPRIPSVDVSAEAPPPDFPPSAYSEVFSAMRAAEQSVIDAVRNTASVVLKR